MRRRHHRGAHGTPGSPGAHLTVRARVLSAVLLLAALAVLIAGAAAYALQAQRTDARIDDSLRRAVDVLRTVATSGPQPEKAQAEFTTAEDLLYDAVQRRGLTENEGVIAFLDGAPHWLASSSVPLRLEADDELVRILGAIPPDSTVELRTVSTAVTQYRLVAIPVSVTGDPHTGLFVVAVDRGAEIAGMTSTYATYAIVTIGSLMIIAVVAWFVVGRLLSPVRLLRDTARQITESDLSERIPVTGTDDLSDLARTVNAMLDRLESAFGSQRELLDDVGHELRTPLTIVRGHLELLDPDDPEDVRATQALALDELDRMHRLVDDLVMLAAAERPDFVRLAPTDVGRLTDDVRAGSADAGGRSPRGPTRPSASTRSGSRRPGCSSSRTRSGSPPRAARSASAARSTATGCCSGSATRAPGSRPRKRTRSSNGSSADARTGPGAGPTAASGWGSRSSLRSPQPTTARSAWSDRRTPRTPGPSSFSTCPPSSSRSAVDSRTSS
jgi:two-component system OmpR family sensor kinase